MADEILDDKVERSQYGCGGEELEKRVDEWNEALKPIFGRDMTEEEREKFRGLYE